MRKAGHFIAPVVVGIGLVLLMIDAEAGLHNPLRFFYLLSNPGSVMMWGVVFRACSWSSPWSPPYSTSSSAPCPYGSISWAWSPRCALRLTPAPFWAVPDLPAGGTIPLLPVLFPVSAMSAGAASVLLVAVIRHADEFNRVGVLKKFHFCLPIIVMSLIASLRFVTAQTNPAGAAPRS